MTKSWQIFDGKMRNLKQHLQLMDLALTQAKKVCDSKKAENGTIAAALTSNTRQYLQLNIPNNANEINRVVAFSRKKLNEQAVIELYRLFSDYLFNTIRDLSHNTPNKLLEVINAKDDRSLSYKELIELGNYDAILEKMAQKVYRALENQRSTPKLLDKILSITNIDINNEIKKEALLYLQIRHLIIHNNSKADDDFINLNDNDIVRIKADKSISFTYALTNKAITTVFKLCKMLDDKLIEKGIVTEVGK